MSYWPTPAQKAWFAVYVDGSCVGIFPDSAAGHPRALRRSRTGQVSAYLTGPQRAILPRLRLHRGAGVSPL